MKIIAQKLRFRFINFAEDIGKSLRRRRSTFLEFKSITVHSLRDSWWIASLQAIFVPIIIYCFRHTPPPGYALAIAAIEVSVASPTVGRRKWLELLLWILIACAFLRVEAVAIAFDRTEHVASHARELLALQEIEIAAGEAHDAQISADAVLRIDRDLARRMLEQTAKLPPQMPAQGLILKIEAMRLTRDIYNFAGRRRGATREFFMPELTADHEKFQREWYGWVNENKRQSEISDAETVREYEMNYWGEVSRITSELKNMGHWKSQACDFADIPSSYVLCASKIESAAQELR
jgi:hypothetical protein